jgi:hypothetical protein
MIVPDLLCEAFNVLFIAQMMHSPFTVPSVKTYTHHCYIDGTICSSTVSLTAVPRHFNKPVRATHKLTSTSTIQV